MSDRGEIVRVIGTWHSMREHKVYNSSNKVQEVGKMDKCVV